MSCTCSKDRPGPLLATSALRGFEDEANMVTELVLFQDSANDPALAVLE